MSGTFPPAAAPSTLKGELKAFRVGSIPAGWTQVSGPALTMSSYIPNTLLPVLSSNISQIRLASAGGALYALSIDSSNVYRFERFNEATGAWDLLPAPNPGVTPNSGVPAGPLLTLPSGRLLYSSVSASSASAAARIYDPATNTWVPAANMPAACRGGGGYVMSNGRAYVCGMGGSAVVACAYDEQTNTWEVRAVNPLQVTTGQFSAMSSCGNGTALAISGTAYHLYDEASNTWSVAKTAQNSVSVLSSAPVFKSGAQLLTPTNTGITSDSTLRVYDIATDTWSVSTELTLGAAAGSDAAQLSDGSWCWCMAATARRLVRRSTTALPTAIVWAVKDE